MSSTARSAVILYDHALRITQINTAARAMLGTGSWTGRTLDECLGHLVGNGPALSGSLDRNHLQEYARSRSAFAVRIGSAVWRAELSAVSEPDPEGGLDDECATVGALILREVGDAENYRDFALERVDFLAALSHDLRTPLNAMTGWLHLLSVYHGRDPELVPRAIAGLRQAVEQQRRMLVEKLGSGHSGAESGRNNGSRPQAEAAAGSRQTGDAIGALGEIDLPEHDAESAIGLSGVFVLAIDDKPEMLEVLTQVLAADGAAIETSTSADEALERYPNWASSGGERLLISDLAMPGRDGFSLIREIRGLERQRRMPRLPAVALSAHGLPDVRRRAIENGYDLFLDKPVDPPVLLGRLHRLLDR